MTPNRSSNAVTQVAEGIYLLERAHVNCYLIVSDDAIVLVDGGLPRTWPLLTAALASIGATPADIDAVLLTHAHFDHVGMCDRLFHEHHVFSRVHEGDVALAKHPYRYAHERARLSYPLRHPASIPVLAGMAAAGALGVKGIDARGDVVPGEKLPGGLVAVFSPGHTYGHCGFYLESKGVLFGGDALVTLDPYTGRGGPQIVAGAATANSPAALAGLDAYVETGARLLLPGHGDPYEGGLRAAVDAALATGAH